MGGAISFGGSKVKPQNGCNLADFKLLSLSKKDVSKFCALFNDVSYGAKHINAYSALLSVEVTQTSLSVKIFAEMCNRKGHLDFREYVLAIWNFCSLSFDMLARAVFHMYDVERKGFITIKTLLQILSDTYDNKSNAHKTTEPLKLEFESEFPSNKTIDLLSFVLISQSHYDFLLPMYVAQTQMRRSTLGIKFWTDVSKTRDTLSEGNYICMERYLQMIDPKSFSQQVSTPKRKPSTGSTPNSTNNNNTNKNNFSASTSHLIANNYSSSCDTAEDSFDRGQQVLNLSLRNPNSFHKQSPHSINNRKSLPNNRPTSLSVSEMKRHYCKDGRTYTSTAEEVHDERSSQRSNTSTSTSTHSRPTSFPLVKESLSFSSNRTFDLTHGVDQQQAHNSHGNNINHSASKTESLKQRVLSVTNREKYTKSDIKYEQISEDSSGNSPNISDKEKEAKITPKTVNLSSVSAFHTVQNKTHSHTNTDHTNANTSGATSNNTNSSAKHHDISQSKQITPQPKQSSSSTIIVVSKKTQEQTTERIMYCGLLNEPLKHAPLSAQKSATFELNLSVAPLRNKRIVSGGSGVDI